MPDIKVWIQADGIHKRSIERCLRCNNGGGLDLATSGEGATVALLLDTCAPEETSVDIIPALLLNRLPVKKDGGHPLPLILTPRPELFLSLPNKYNSVPHGHVFDTSSGDSKGPSVLERLRSRIRQLDLSHAELNNNGDPQKTKPLPTAVVWDWIADAIRLKLGLHPDAHHAIRSLQSPNDRVEVGKKVGPLVEILGSGVFKAYVSPLKGELEKHSPDDVAIDKAQPRQTGAAFLAGHALCRMTALVIDDDVGKKDADPCQKLAAAAIGQANSKLGSFIVFDGLHITSGDSSRLEDFLSGRKTIIYRGGKRMETLTPTSFYDFFLLDLSFGENDDVHFGYHVLWRLKTVCPDTPILIHSSFGQRSEVIMAIQQGADWYIQKSDTQKLANHLANRVARASWHASELPQHVTFDILPALSQKPDIVAEFKYLWWKVTRDLPGTALRVTKLGGGDNATTCKVEKRIAEDWERASPVVVKIDNPHAIRLERERYRRFIFPFISNYVGRVDFPVVCATSCAATGYTYAGAEFGRTLGHRPRLSSYSSLLQRLLRKSSVRDEDIQLAIKPAQVLFDRILPKIHQQDPQWDSAHYPYPNEFFDEFADRTWSFLFRMPARFEIELQAVGDAQNNPVWESELKIDAEITLHDAKLLEIAATPDYGGSAPTLKVIQMVSPADGGDPRPYRFDAKPAPDNPVFRDMVFRRLSRFGIRGIIRPNPKDEAELADMRGLLLDTILQASPRFGIVHGDLHLDNILFDVEWEPDGIKIPGDPWLIDFGRTRRDSLVHDFALMEEAVATTLLSADLFSTSSRLRNQQVNEFIHSWLFTTPWPPPSLKHDKTRRLELIYQLLRLIRNQAVVAGIAGTYGDQNDYLAALGIYMQVPLKRRTTSEFGRDIIMSTVRRICQHLKKPTKTMKKPRSRSAKRLP